jgi:hypothetical protein
MLMLRDAAFSNLGAETWPDNRESMTVPVTVQTTLRERTADSRPSGLVWVSILNLPARRASLMLRDAAFSQTWVLKPGPTIGNP